MLLIGWDAMFDPVEVQSKSKLLLQILARPDEVRE
jgi:hypothetical protein